MTTTSELGVWDHMNTILASFNHAINSFFTVDCCLFSDVNCMMLVRIDTGSAAVNRNVRALFDARHIIIQPGTLA